MLRVSDCIVDRVGLAMPQPTEWQHVGNEIEAAMIFAWTNEFNRVMDRLGTTRDCCGDAILKAIRQRARAS